MWKDVNLQFGCLVAKEAEGIDRGLLCNGRLCAVLENTIFKRFFIFNDCIVVSLLKLKSRCFIWEKN
jgi:hypothetical protein